jgi:hypothetical protein
MSKTSKPVSLAPVKSLAKPIAEGPATPPVMVKVHQSVPVAEMAARLPAKPVVDVASRPVETAPAAAKPVVAKLASDTGVLKAPMVTMAKPDGTASVKSTAVTKVVALTPKAPKPPVAKLVGIKPVVTKPIVQKASAPTPATAKPIAAKPVVAAPVIATVAAKPVAAPARIVASAPVPVAMKPKVEVKPVAPKVAAAVMPAPVVKAPKAVAPKPATAKPATAKPATPKIATPKIATPEPAAAPPAANPMAAFAGLFGTDAIVPSLSLPGFTPAALQSPFAGTQMLATMASQMVSATRALGEVQAALLDHGVAQLKAGMGELEACARSTTPSEVVVIQARALRRSADDLTDTIKTVSAKVGKGFAKR